MLGSYENYIYLNPFNSVVELIRDPLLGYNISAYPIIILILSAIIGNLFFFFLIKFKGHRLIFWAQ